MRSARNTWRVFTSLFKKKKIIFGRTGIAFFDEDKIYFINSELLEEDDADVKVYDNDIYYVEDNVKVMLSENERNEILRKLELEMEKTGLMAVMPEKYIKWRDLIR
jgi:hypothetical protein